LKAVLAYPPAEFFARFMKAAAGAAPAAAGGKAEVLGAVPEGSDRAYVVVRAARKPADGGKGVVEVISVSKVDGEWKADVTLGRSPRRQRSMNSSASGPTGSAAISSSAMAAPRTFRGQWSGVSGQ
jgi:hypothetical protein